MNNPKELLGNIIPVLQSESPDKVEEEKPINGDDQSINLFEILQNIDLNNIDQNEIKNSENQNIINTVLDIIKTTPQKELHDLSKAIEDNPNGLKDLLGLSTSPDPSIVKVVAGILKTQLAK